MAKFWEDSGFEAWAAERLLRASGRSPRRRSSYPAKYRPPPPTRNADTLSTLRKEAAGSYGSAMMAPYVATPERRFRTGQYGAKFRAGAEAPAAPSIKSPIDPRLLKALRMPTTPQLEQQYAEQQIPKRGDPRKFLDRQAIAEEELSLKEYMSARSTKPDQREDSTRLVPYDFGIGDIFKIQLQWQIENIAITNTILRGEVSPYVGAGRLLESWWKHGKQLVETPEGQTERVWIDVEDPETGETTVVPADIRKRPPAGRLLSSPWLWTKGKVGQLRQSSPGLDVFASGIEGLISVGKLGFSFSPYGLIARLVGMNVRNPFAAPVEKEPVNFWDYFPTSMYWNERVLERIDDVREVWGAGVEFMQDYMEMTPPSNQYMLKGVDESMLPEGLRKPYDEMTVDEKDEYVMYVFASQRIVSVPEYRFYFDKLKELNPDWSSDRVRKEAAQMTWSAVNVGEVLHSDVVEGFGDLMGAAYYYALATGAFMDPEKHPWFNQEAFAAEAWEKAVKEYAQEGNQLFIQGLKKIGDTVVEVDPDFSYTWTLDEEAEQEYMDARDLVSDQLGRDLGYWEAFRLKERYEDPVIEMIGESVLDIGNLAMFNVVWEGALKGGWRILRSTGAKTLDLSYMVPVLGDGIRWLTRETTVSLSRRVGFRASEFFATIMQSSKNNRAFVALVDEFGQLRRIPVSVGDRQLRYADELAQYARPEEWARMADNAVERATLETRRMAMANGITDLRTLDNLPTKKRLVVEELANTFEAIFINNARAKYGDRLVTKGTVVLGNAFDWLRRGWIEQVLSARPGFTAINFVDSGFRHILYGAAPLQNIDDILRRTPIPREIYMRFPVTEAGAALPMGQAPRYGPLTYFLNEIGTSTIVDLPWPLGKRPFWTRSADVVEAFAGNHPAIYKAMRVWNWGNFGSAMKQYNAWFEFAMSVRLYDSIYWRTFLPMDAKVGERLIVQLLGDASPETVTRAGRIWKQAEANPAKLQQLIAESVYGKGAGRGRPVFSFLIPDEVNSWLRGMPVETQQTFINNAVERLRPVLREADWTPERLRSVVDDLMDEYLKEWSAINRTMDADEFIASRGIIDPERAAQAASARRVDDLGRQVEKTIDDARKMDATPQASHPIVDDILDANALPDGYTEPSVMARALNRGADPSPAQLERVQQLLDEGIIVRDPEAGTVGLREDLVEEWIERKGVDKPKVTVPVDEEQVAAQAGVITPEQQAAGEALADEVEEKAKTLGDALEEAKAIAVPEEAERKARILTGRATDEQLLEAMDVANRELIEAGSHPIPLTKDGLPDYAATEWLRRNPPPDAPVDPFLRPPSDGPDRPSRLTPEERQVVRDEMDAELAALAEHKGPDAQAAREAGKELRVSNAKLYDEIARQHTGEFPEHLRNYWDDLDQMRSRTQDWLRYEIFLFDQSRGFYSKTKIDIYWRVQAEIYQAHKMLADEMVEMIATGEVHFIERMSILDYMDTIGFPLELDANGRLVAIHDATKIWRKRDPLEMVRPLHKFESTMMRGAPEGHAWTDPFFGRQALPSPPKAAPGPAVPPSVPSGPVMGPTAPVKPIADGEMAWSLGKVQTTDIQTIPEFQPRSTSGEVMQVDRARIKSIASQWDWKQYEPVKINVVQAGEAHLYGKGIKEGDMVLMGGHHRLGAAQLAGKTELPSMVYQLPYEEAQYLSSIDNMIRAEQTAFEKGRVFANRIAAGDSETDLARVCYNDPNKASYVSRLASLTELSPDIARDVGRYGWFGESHGFAFVDAVREFSINPEFQQQIFVKYLAEYQLSVTQFKQFLKTFGPKSERAVQMGLFAMDESWLSAFAKTQDEIRELNKRARRVSGVIKDPSLADELGVDIDQAKQIIEDLKAKKAELERLSGVDPAIPRTMQDVEVTAAKPVDDAVKEAEKAEAQKLAQIEVKELEVSKSRVQELVDGGETRAAAEDIAKQEVLDAEKIRVEEAAELAAEAPVEIEPSAGEIEASTDAAPSIAVSESVGQARPHSAVPGAEGRSVPRRSPATHAGGGLAEGVRTDSGIVTVSSELLPQPGEYVSAEYLNDVYERTRGYFLKQGLGEEEATLKAFSFFEHQIDTANRAFTSFDTAKGYVVAAGTGTGKTYAGALIVDQVIERGGSRHLLVAPNRQIISQWEDVLKPLGIEVRQFATKDALPEAIITGERGVVYATTYNSMNSWAQKKTFSQMLSNQQLDLLIFDESHYLKNWYQEVNTAVAGVDLGEWADHTLYLSATPLESPLHAGYMMRDTNIWDSFDDMLEHLGIERVEREVTRYGAGGEAYRTYIETFDNVTPESLAALNDELVREGRWIRHTQSFRNNFNKTTGEALYMYSASVPVPITQDTADMYSRFMEITDKFSVGRSASIIEAQRVGIGRAILENGKLDAAIALGERKLADGNSVAFFVWRKQGSKFDQHLTDFMSGAKTYGRKSPMPGYYKALIESGVEVKSPVDILKAQFPDAVVISGDVTGAKRIAAMEAFNSGKSNVVIATIDAGGTGLSLHDVIGDYPRVQINLTVPYTALGVDQTAGRTFRMGSQSHGELYWLYADIALEEKYTKRTMKSMERMGALISGQDAAAMASDDEMLEFLFAIDDATTPSPYSDIPTELLPSEAGFEIPTDRTIPPWKREGWETQHAAGVFVPDASTPTVGLPSAQLVIDPKMGPETLQEARDLASFDLEAYAHIEELGAHLEDLAGKMEKLRLKGATAMEIQVVANDMSAITDEIAEVARAAEQPMESAAELASYGEDYVPPPRPSVFDVPPEARAPGDPQPMVVATEAGPQVTMFGESIVAGEEFLVDEVHKQAFEQSAFSRQWIAQFGDEARDHATFLRMLEKDRDRIVQAIARGDLVKGADKPVQDLINEINSLAQQLKYNIGDTPDMFVGCGFIPIWMRPKGKVVQQAAAQGAVAELHAAMNAYDNWYRWLIEGGADDMFKAIPEEDAQKMVDWAKAALKAKAEVRDVARHGGELAGEAVEGALPETLKVMIDYATEYNIDSIAKKFFPFWKFPTRSIPFWLEAISTHPQLLAFWMKYQNMSERFVYQQGAIDSQGRPLNRLRGYIPVPGTDGLWINPLGPLSAKVVLPMEYTVYGDPRDEMADMGPAEQTINIAYRWGRQLGFNLAPWWESLIRKTGMVDREQFPSRSIIPALDLVPPWIQYDILYQLRRLHLWPEDQEYLTPQVTWKDYLVERDMLAMQYDVMLEAPPEERAEIALATEQAVLEREGNPIWDKAQKYTEETEYYNRLIGFFTGIYPKTYSDAEAALRELRHEINFLRDMTNDEVGAKIFDLPGEEAARRERWMERRYSVDEGVIYGLYSTISWTRTPTEGQLYGERRREYVEQDVLKQIQRRDYFAYNDVIYDELQTNLESLPVGAPHELREGYYDEYAGHKAWAETTDNYALARRTVTHPGFGRSESEWADWFADTWYGILLSTKPSWDKDNESYPEYKERVAQWERDLPMIAEQTLPHFQKDLTTLPPDAVWPDLLSISNKEAMSVWDLENDSALDALNRVWEDQYWSAFWEAVEGKTGYERDLAEMRFKMAWPAAPNEQTLLKWVEQLYGNKFSREELREILNSGVMDVQGRLDAVKTDQEKMADQIWLWMSWVGPNKKELERAFWTYGGDPRDWDKWWSSEGDPLAWKEDEFEKFYSLITAAAGSLSLQEPTMDQLQEWSYVQELHNTYKQLAKVTFGENIFVISAQYSELPRAERAAFKAAHPELELFWNLRDQYAVDHPLWAQYYNPQGAKAASGGGGYSGTGGRGGYGSSTNVRGREQVQTLPTLAGRSSTDVRDLLERGVGRGRATRLVKWPVTLQKVVPDELVEEVEKAAETGDPISEAANDYLEYLKTTHPQEQSFLESIQRMDLFAHREKPYGAGQG